MPLKSFNCTICGMGCPREWLQDGKFKERISWLRHHRMLHHPYDFIASTRKGVKTRKGSRRENG